MPAIIARFILLSFLFILTFTVNAQLREKYIAGSIQLKNNQKLEGFIKDDEIAIMNFKIFFKTMKNQKDPVVYDTSSVKKVSLSNGEAYELLLVKPPYINDSFAVLAKLMLSGKASLYELYYQSDNILLIENEGKIYTLQDDKLEINATELQPYYFKNNLINAFYDAKELHKKINYMSFNEKDIIKLVIDYNQSKSSESIIIKSSRNPIHFFIIDLGGMIKNKSEDELYVQLIYRTYFSKISKSTSLNLGISYYFSHFSETISSNHKANYTQTLLSIPFQIQQNILNKNFRPYIFTGFNLSYIKLVSNDNFGRQLENGLQKSYGIAFLYGLGVEADIYKGIRVKTEYRYENYSHLISLGVGYNFSKF